MGDKRPKGKEPKPEELLFEDLDLGSLDKAARSRLCDSLRQYIERYWETGTAISDNDLINLLNIIVMYNPIFPKGDPRGRELTMNYLQEKFPDKDEFEIIGMLSTNKVKTPSSFKHKSTLLGELIKRKCFPQLTLIVNELIHRGNLSFVLERNRVKYYLNQIFNRDSDYYIYYRLNDAYGENLLSEDDFVNILNYFLNIHMSIDETIDSAWINEYLERLKTYYVNNKSLVKKLNNLKHKK